MISVEIVATAPDRQLLLELELPEGSTLADAIEASRILARFPEFDRKSLKFGIWGRVVDAQQALKDGDRVEVYRPLEIDPREARRRRALAGRTMRG